jgi:hypothetical protein
VVAGAVVVEVATACAWALVGAAVVEVAVVCDEEPVTLCSPQAANANAGVTTAANRTNLRRDNLVLVCFRIYLYSLTGHYFLVIYKEKFGINCSLQRNLKKAVRK